MNLFCKVSTWWGSTFLNYDHNFKNMICTDMSIYLSQDALVFSRTGFSFIRWTCALSITISSAILNQVHTCSHWHIDIIYIYTYPCWQEAFFPMKSANEGCCAPQKLEQMLWNRKVIGAFVIFQMTRNDTLRRWSMCPLTRFDTVWHAQQFCICFCHLSKSLCMSQGFPCQNTGK